MSNPLHETKASRHVRFTRAAVVVLATVLGGLSVAACAAPIDEASEASSDELRCTNAKASKLARVALRVSGWKSQGLCFRKVKEHLLNAGFQTSHLQSAEQGRYRGHAYLFSTWAKKYPAELAKMGLEKADLGLNELPKGALIIWPRGMCGYSKESGHSEIVIDDDSSRACSDFCGRIKKGCGQPDIFVPKGCGSYAPDEGDSEELRPMPRPDGGTDDGTDDGIDDGIDDGTDGEPEIPLEGADGDTDEIGSCWSPTLDKQMPLHSCVKSRSSGIVFQCKDGLWYRGVQGSQGPFGACASMH